MQLENGLENEETCLKYCWNKIQTCQISCNFFNFYNIFMFSWGTERDKWHDMGWGIFTLKNDLYTINTVITGSNKALK